MASLRLVNNSNSSNSNSISNSNNKNSNSNSTHNSNSKSREIVADALEMSANPAGTCFGDGIGLIFLYGQAGKTCTSARPRQHPVWKTA